jgi:CubicO group peptidase (beta-lactamase class C family)
MRVPGMLIRIAFSTLLFASVAAASTDLDAATLLPERVAKAAQERIDAGTYPSLVIAYVDGDKSEVLGFGKLDDGSAPDGTTVYEIGSITKTFTATLLAEAVQSGKLKLDDPLSTLLPDFKIPSRNGKPITLLDLATQHSGLPRLPTNLAPADPANPYADYDGAKLRTFLAGYELPRDPGASYEYSNLGFGLLGYALARQAHVSYAQLLQQKIFGPLRMPMSGLALNDAMRTHLAAGHGQDGKTAKNWDFDALAGCGAIRSNADDLLRYLKANMSANPSVLAQAMQLAHEPRRDLGANTRIGLAWMTHTAKPSDIVWHNGMTYGYASFLGFRANGRRGVLILTNSMTSVDELGMAALLDDAPLTPARQAVSIDPATLDDYVGDYKLAENFLINIARRDGQLYAQATGQGAFPIFPSATNEFFAKIADIRISFQRDMTGKVSALVLHQNGDRTAPKLNASAAPLEPKWIEIDAAALQDYVGKYQLAPGAVLDITRKDDQLFAQLTGQAAYPIYALATNIFRYKVVDAQLDFERDSDQHVIALHLHQNGQNLRAARINP